MVLERRAVGIDLGARSVKAVDLRVSGQGVTVARALRVERSELPGGLEELGRGLRERLGRERIPAKGVVLGISGPDTMVRYTRVPPVPSWRLKVLMDFEVGEMTEKTGEPLASGFQLLQLPREAEEDQTILIGLVKEKALSERLDAFEGAGITVSQAVLGPLAVFSAQDAFGWKPDEGTEEDDLALLADLGEENLALAFSLNGRLVFARSASFGGKSFTEALARRLGIDPADAERVKVARGGVFAEEAGVHPETVAPLSEAAAQLLALLQSSIRFAGTQTGTRLPPLSRIVLLGGGMRLRGLGAFLSRSFGKPTELFQPAGLRLSGSLPEPAAKDLAERAGDYGVALGLAAAGLRSGGRGNAAPLVPSILPEKYLKRREFQDRTMFLYGAGAILLIILLVNLARGIVRNSGAQSVIAELSQAQAQLQTAKREYDSMLRDAEVKKARLNRLLAEAEQTAFQAYSLDLLARVLRPEMRLERVYLDDSVLLEDETTSDYGLYLECKVSNEKRQGLQWIGELQETLRADDKIRSVEIVSSDSDRLWRSFKLLIKPKYVAY
jgi:Tfp pilus assembly PilM family ATPase